MAAQLKARLDEEVRRAAIQAAELTDRCEALTQVAHDQVEARDALVHDAAALEEQLRRQNVQSECFRVIQERLQELLKNRRVVPGQEVQRFDEFLEELQTKSDVSVATLQATGLEVLALEEEGRNLREVLERLQAEKVTVSG
jgi:hypothetical protein